MKEPTESEIKEVWEWCGFYEEIKVESEHSWKRWVYPDGQTSTSLPSIDLNNLFKDATDRVRDKIGEKEYYKLLLRWINIFTENNSDPALALFWAIQELIKE